MTGLWHTRYGPNKQRCICSISICKCSCRRVSTSFGPTSAMPAWARALWDLWQCHKMKIKSSSLLWDYFSNTFGKKGKIRMTLQCCNNNQSHSMVSEKSSRGWILLTPLRESRVAEKNIPLSDWNCISLIKAYQHNNICM